MKISTFLWGIVLSSNVLAVALKLKDSGANPLLYLNLLFCVWMGWWLHDKHAEFLEKVQR